MTSEHLRQLVAMETDERLDSARDVTDKLAELDQFHRLTAVSYCS